MFLSSAAFFIVFSGACAGSQTMVQLWVPLPNTIVDRR